MGLLTLFGSSWEISSIQNTVRQRFIAPSSDFNTEPTADSEIVTKSSTKFEYVSQTLDPRFPTPPGDMGSGVVMEVTDAAISALVKQGYDMQGLNQFFSDLMSVQRRLPDVRDNWCKEPGRFLSDLPETSIVIVFYNEAWSVLVRTVHSILDRSPPNLVKEIVLVDDCSYLRKL